MGRKIAAAFITLLFFYIFLPLVIPVAMGVVLGTLLYPLLARLEKIKISNRIAAPLLTISVTFIVILPSAFLIFLGAKAGLGEVQRIKEAAAVGSGTSLDNLIHTPRFQSLLETLTQWLPVTQGQILGALQDLAAGVGLKVADLLGQLLTHLPSMTIGLIIMILTIYFVLMDGQRLLNMLRRYSVFTFEETDQFLQMMAVMCRSVVLASVASGLAQSICMLIGCWITGVDDALLVAFLVFLSSFIPIIGSAPITIGLALQQFLLGQTTHGVVLCVFAVAVGLVDGLVRPWFIRGSANLHPLLAFFAALGGVQVLGFLGIFLGPIIAAMFVLVIQILTTDRESMQAKA